MKTASTSFSLGQQLASRSRPGIPRTSARPQTLLVGPQHQCTTGLTTGNRTQTACSAATLQKNAVGTLKGGSQTNLAPEAYALSQFEIGEVLGVGRQGIVKRAVHVPTGKEFAAKLLAKDVAVGSNPGVLKKLRGEAAIMASLQGAPNVANLVTTTEDEEHIYIVMEFLGGGSLQDKIDEGRLPESSVKGIMYHVVEFLAACHKEHVVFGDVKPANFMLTSDKKPKIKAIDFGCSQKMVPGLFLRNRVGSPLYMAPEVHLGGYGLESDMWSAGVMLYQLLTGKLPFVQEEDGCVVETGLHLGYSFEGEEWAGISESAKQLVTSLLVRDRKKRLTAKQALGSTWFPPASGIVHFNLKPGSEDDKQISSSCVTDA